MALLDLNVSWEDAEKETEFPVLDPNLNPYKFRVAGLVPPRDDNAGGIPNTHRNKDNTRDMYVYELEVFGCSNDDFNGTKWRYYCPLPYVDDEGKTVTKGIGLLASLVKGTGNSWEGTSFDCDSLLGCEGEMIIANSEYDGKVSTSIKKIVA
jgi:hypothetical protein